MHRHDEQIVILAFGTRVKTDSASSTDNILLETKVVNPVGSPVNNVIV